MIEAQANILIQNSPVKKSNEPPWTGIASVLSSKLVGIQQLKAEGKAAEWLATVEHEPPSSSQPFSKEKSCFE